jgi:hypothetical protein
VNTITRFNPEDGGGTASETLVSNHRHIRRNNPTSFIVCGGNTGMLQDASARSRFANKTVISDYLLQL